MSQNLPEMPLFKAMRKGFKAIVGKEPIFRYGVKGKRKIGEVIQVYDPSRKEGSKLFSYPRYDE